VVVPRQRRRKGRLNIENGGVVYITAVADTAKTEEE
jgi:hypothetical protein